MTKAARKARIDRMSLYRLMQRHDVKPEGHLTTLLIWPFVRRATSRSASRSFSRD